MNRNLKVLFFKINDFTSKLNTMIIGIGST